MKTLFRSFFVGGFHAKSLLAKLFRIARPPVFRALGSCPVCGRKTEFVARNPWLRDHFICANCESIPRERALMTVLDTYFPKWREAVVHESSPSPRGVSLRLAKECTQYVPTQYFPGHRGGSVVHGVRCENLEDLTFESESIDLHITQDVLEHVFNPSLVFKEVERTLKPGGMHIFTVPLVNRSNPTRFRASVEDGQIVYMESEQYHGSPVGDGRCLVTVDWGFDICRHIYEACGLFTHIIHIDDLGKGIRAEYIEVLVTIKTWS